MALAAAAADIAGGRALARRRDAVEIAFWAVAELNIRDDAQAELGAVAAAVLQRVNGLVVNIAGFLELAGRFERIALLGEIRH